MRPSDLGSSRRFSRLRPFQRRHKREHRRLLLESLETRQLLDGSWQNPFNPRDITGDGVVVPIDPLVQINELNNRQYINELGELPDRSLFPNAPYYDFNGDGRLVPLDVLPIINAYNGDDAPPVITVGLAHDTGPGGTTNDDLLTTDPRLAGTVTDNTGVSSLTISINDGTPQVVPVLPGGSFSFNPPLATDGSQDGEHLIKVIARDGRQNASTPAEFTFRLDTIIPPVPTDLTLDPSTDTGEPDGITNNNRPIIRGDSPAGTVIQVFAGESLVGQTTANSPWSVQTAPLADGAQTLTVRAFDPAGNPSAESTVELTIDTTPPAAPADVRLTAASDSGVSNSDGITNDSTPTIRGSAESGSLVRISIDDETFGPFAGGEWEFTPPALTDGTYSVTVTAEDVAGNVSSASTPFQLIIDTAAPAAPTGIRFTAATDTGRSDSDGVTKDASPVLIGQGNASVSIEVRSGDDVVGTATGSASWQLQLEDLSDGSYSFSAVAIDVAGNRSPLAETFLATIDTVAPAAPTALQLTAATDSGTSSTDGITNATSPVATGDAETNALVRLLVNGEFAGQQIANSPWAIGTGALSEGVFQLTATAEDLAGNVGPASTAFTIEIDTTAPNAPANLRLTAATDSGASNSDGITNVTAPSATGAAEDGATVRVFVDGDLASTTTSNGTWVTAIGTLTEGAHDLTARAEDRAGNVSAVSATAFITIDLTAPAAPANLRFDSVSDTGASSSDGITRVTTPTVVGDIETGAVVTVLVNGQTVGTAVSGGSFSFTTSELADGSYSVTARASDLAGNLGPVSAVFAATIDTIAPSEPVFNLSTTSDTGTLGDNQTTAARVTLVGITDPRANLTLLERSLNSLAGLSGSFQIPSVLLQQGSNPLTVRAADLAGNERTFQRTLELLEEPAGPDPVLAWNDVILEAIRLDASAPPVATRFLAMVHAAIYDAVAAIEDKPSLLAAVPAPAGASPDAAVASAAHKVLMYAYPGQKATFDTALAASLAAIPDGQGKTDGIAVGQNVAEAIIAIRSGDGWDDFTTYVGSTAVGRWQPTIPMFAPALLPHWGTLDPFTLESPSQYRPAPPPALTSPEYATALNEVQSLGKSNSSARTADQTQIARFWSDGSGTYTPPGHWNQIAAEIAAREKNGLADNARLFAQLNLAFADVSIAVWDAKYAYGFWRPVTAIRDADLDGNEATQVDETWAPLITTPPFPEYVSGHSTYSGAAASILAAAFTDDVAFVTSSLGLPNVERSYTSFSQAAEEAGRSRIYGGIHFEFANQAGLATGEAIASHVLHAFSVSTDTRPPVILLDRPSGQTTAQNLTLQGHALDNLSGVASLEVAIDGGSFSSLERSPAGAFGLTTEFRLTGEDDGIHTLVFRAVDAEGNIATQTFTVVLDTRAPVIVIATPTDGGELVTGARLAGTIDGTGSPIVELTYQIDGGTPVALSVASGSGAFNAALNLSQLPVGDHVLTIRGRDAAGHVAVIEQDVHLAELPALRIASHLPVPNATEVGVTYRPRVNFTRPVNPATLNAGNFYVSDAAGNKLPATIVPAQDGTFAWLYVRDPLPGASRVTVTVNGSSIASPDGALLDADGDGTAGGTFTFSFNTVSRTNLVNTSITGIIADPGPDLKPGTRDDVLPGPDAVLMTADDVYLLPIANVKVFILGREDEAVFTDSQGRFTLESVPAGDVKLAMDGLTATNPPAGFYFPEMVMDLEIEPGIANLVMQAMQRDPLRRAEFQELGSYLPRLQTSLLQAVDAAETTLLGVDAVSAPNLTDQQRNLLTIEIQPGSLIGPDGQPLADGQVGISTVPPELVRDMLPPGVLEHTFDITIQAPGISNFSAPAPMSFPNVFNAPPGTKLNFLSFDHTTGRLVIEGTATVSADGLSVTTDPDTGITHPGWHGLTPPGTRGRSDVPRGGGNGSGSGGSGGGSGGGGSGGGSGGSGGGGPGGDGGGCPCPPPPPTPPTTPTPPSWPPLPPVTPPQPPIGLPPLPVPPPPPVPQPPIGQPPPPPLPPVNPPEDPNIPPGYEVPVPGPRDNYDIVLRYIDSTVTLPVRNILETAAVRWERIVIGDVPDVYTDIGMIDDLVIDVRVGDQDGAGGVLGKASSTLTRTGTGLPARAVLELDAADVAILPTDQLAVVARRLIGQTLGLGQKLWDSRIVEVAPGDLRYTGANAAAQFNQIFGTSGGIPVSSHGTLDSPLYAWRESVLDHELFTSELDAGTNPISRITVGALADLGYQVNFAAADPFTPSVNPTVAGTLQYDQLGVTAATVTAGGFRGDFATPDSTVPNGFTRVTAQTAYSAAQGYGWQSTSGLAHSVVTSDPRANELWGDYVSGQNSTFLVDLPPGLYDIKLTVGDFAHDRIKMEVMVEGFRRGALSTTPGQLITNTYRANVTDGQLQIRISGESGFSVDALEINQVSAVSYLEGPAGELTGKFFFLLQNLDNGFLMRGAIDQDVPGPLCPEGVFLAPNTSYRQWVYHLDSGSIGVSDFTTPPTGIDFEMPEILLGRNDSLDTDAEGLGDVAEFIVGTSKQSPDTDGDGLSDWEEVRQGLDPLTGRAYPTGLVAAVELPGEAVEVVVVPTPGRAGDSMALVATGDYGLVVVDVSDFDAPRIEGRLNLSGFNSDVVFDGGRNWAFLAAERGGLHMVDVSQPQNPQLLKTIVLDAGLSRLEFANGVIYGISGNQLVAIDPISEEIEVLSVSSANLVDLAIDRATLFTLGSNSQLRSFDLSPLGVVEVGSLGLTTRGIRLTVGNGVALIGDYETGGFNFLGGFVTVDVSNAAEMSLLSDMDDQSLVARSMANTGSGFGIGVGDIVAGAGIELNRLDLIDLRDLTNTGAFVTSFDLPGQARAVTIANGIAFIAGGTAGLQVVNYLPFDNNGISPTVTILSGVTDVDGNAADIQVVEGTRIPIQVSVADDVQVARVDMLINGQFIGTDLSYPFDFEWLAPLLSSEDPRFEVQVRAWDSGGNVANSNVLAFESVADTVGPVVVGSSPLDGSRRLRVAAISIRFDEEIDPDVPTAAISLLHLGADNAPGGGDDTMISDWTLDTSVRGRLGIVLEDELLPGRYELTLDPAGIADLAGNQLADPFVANFTKRPPKTPIELNTTVSGELFASDEEEVFAFQGAVGQRLYFDGLLGNWPLLGELVSPSGAIVQRNFSPSSDLHPFSLIETGEYLFRVFTQSDIGSFQFRWLDLAAQPQVALDETYGFGLQPISATLVGSYFDADLAGSGQDDWRQTESVAGTRNETVVNFTTSDWGGRSAVNLTGGSDDDWDNYSVQWDGTITIPAENAGSHVYLRTADGSRLWIDLNGDGEFSNTSPEFIDNSFGQYGLFVSSASSALAAGTYSIRIQMHAGDDWSHINSAELLWDGGVTIEPPASVDIVTFEGTANQRIFLDALALHPNLWSANWTLYSPSNEYLTGAGVLSDLNQTLPGDGLYAIVFTSQESTEPVPYQFRVRTPSHSTVPLTLGTETSGTLTEPAESIDYTFSATAGTRIYFDGLGVSNQQLLVELHSPTGSRVQSGYGVTDFGPITLLEAGTYRLRFQNFGQQETDFRFRLSNLADLPLLQLDQVYGSGLAPVPAASLNGVTGSYFDGSVRDEEGAIDIFEDWTSLFAARFSGSRAEAQLNFPETSSWGLATDVGLVGRDDSNWDDYSVQWDGELIVTDPDTRVFLRNDDGARLILDLNLDGNLSPLDYLTGLAQNQAGTQPGLPEGYLNNGWGGAGHHQLSASYYILQPGVYRFRLNYEEGFGENELQLLWGSNDLFSADETRLYRVTGQAGQELFFNSHLDSQWQQAQWVLYDPTDVAVGNFQNTSQDFAVQLPREGEYLLVLQGVGQPNVLTEYQFEARIPEKITTSLSFGTPVTGSLSAPGDEKLFTFQGSAGQQIYLDDLEAPASDNVHIDLVTPAGSVQYTWQHHGDNGPITLLSTGTYTLRVDAYGDATGDYSFALWDAADAPAVTLDVQLTDTLDPGTMAHLFRFAGTTGQRVAVDHQTFHSCDNHLSIYAPSSTIVHRSCLSDSHEFTLPEDGDYLVVISGNDSTAPVDYDFTLEATATTVTALPGFGVEVSGSLADSGDQQIFTFAATAGEQLLYDALEAVGEAIRVELRDPAGQVVFDQFDENDLLLSPFIQTGTYQLRLYGQSNATGGYRFQLLKLANSTPLSLGTPVVGSLDVGRETLLYRFDGVPGQIVDFHSESPSRLDASWRLIDPAGNYVSSGWSIDGHPSTVLLLNGTYTLEISGAFDDATPLDFDITLSDATEIPVVPSGFGTVQTGNIAAEGQIDIPLNANAGAIFYFNSLDRDFDGVSVTLIDPDGTPLLSLSASQDYGPIFLNDTGTYTLRVTASEDGDFNFRVLDLTSANATEVPSTISLGEQVLPPYWVDAYRVSATAGQLFFFDELGDDADQLRIQVLRPDLTWGNTYYVSSDPGTFVANANGTYFFLVENLADEPADYDLRLFERASATPLTVGTPQSGTLTPGTEVEFFQFAATAGDRFFVQGDAANDPSLYWWLWTPAGNQPAWGWLASDSDFTVPSSGQYLFAVQSQGDATPRAYEFKISVAETVIASLPGFDVEVTATLNNPRDERHYTFNGTAGQKLYFDALESASGNINVHLFTPSQHYLISDSTAHDSQVVVLPENGEYELQIVGTGRATGDVRFQVQDLNVATPLVIGDLTSTVHSSGSHTRWFAFEADAETRYYFDYQGTENQGINWWLHHPNGTTWHYLGRQDQSFTVPVDGQYFVQTSGDDSPALAQAKFRISAAETDVQPLVFGSTYGGSSLHFLDPSVTVGQISNVLRGPDGRLYVASEWSGEVRRFDEATGAFIDEFIPAGDSRWGMAFGPDGHLYVANRDLGVVDRFDGATGEFLETVISAGSSPLTNPRGLTFGPDGNLYIANFSSDEILRFDGTTGAFLDVFVAAGSGGLDSPHSPSFGPDGHLYVSSYESHSVLRFDGTTGDFLDEFVISGAGGLHNPIGRAFLANGDLLVSSASGSVLRYGPGGEFLGEFATESGARPIDVLVASNQDVFVATTSTARVRRYTSTGGCVADTALCSPGEHDDYTFVGTAGQRILFDSLMAPNSSHATWELLGPGGAFVTWGNASQDSALITLPHSGMYRLRLSSPGGTADYKFQVLEYAGQPVVLVDSPIVDSVASWEAAFYQFNGLASQRLTVMFDHADCNTVLTLISPSNQSVTSICQGGYTEITLPTSGPYAITVTSYVLTPADFTFTVGSAETHVMPLGAFNTPITGNLSEPGEVDVYTFTASVGQRLIPQVNATGNFFDYEVRTPGGRIIPSHEIGLGQPLTITESGVWQLIIDGYQDATGEYQFRIDDVGSAPSVEINELTEGLLTPDHSFHVYQLQGIAGQEFFFDWQSPENCSAELVIYSPGNVPLDGTCLGNFQIALPVTGTYVIIVDGFQPDSEVPYSFQISTSALLAGDSPDVLAATTLVTDDALLDLLDEAVQRWIAAGVSAELLAERLRSVQFEFDELPAGYLAATQAGRVVLDREANGAGWFVDDSPWEDSEFSASDDPEGYDLLSVLMHEIGHLLGVPHTSQGVMQDRLPRGTRSAIDASALDALFGGEEEW